ncbi:hypothetical protein EST38_g5150 [Candolleomyces aberdarensis]|uniref:Uncharacterized protein n=1 Tax=Candolleomyces aberdarensis TaxID=2316362 RepID=A0A4Q2DL75_9AGAR|nr:hypothetical protein EST38_g5150 [Candolleomyces aberdarensis]
MNAYSSLPPCLDDTSSLDRAPSKVNQPHNQSNLIQHSRKLFLQTYSSAFIESALAPAKYALFQLLGAALLQIFHCPGSPPYAISAKIGAFGGIVVTIFYLMLVLTGNTAHCATRAQNEEDVNDLRHPGQSVMMLVHEMLYSTLASIIGCMGYTMTGPLPVSLPIHAFSGCVGPAVFLSSLFVIVGTVWCIVKAQKKLLDWYAGY